MRREYSVGEMNIFGKEVGEVINRNNARRFPVILSVDNNGNLNQYPTLSELKTVDSRAIKIEEKDPEGNTVMHINGILKTYETSINGEKFKVVLPVTPDLPPAKLLEHAADILEYAEAMRTLVLSYMMIMPDFRKLDSESVSVMLSDKLLETAGVSLKIEKILQNKFGKNSPEVQAQLKKYGDTKTVSAMLDKAINIVYSLTASQFRRHAEALTKLDGMEETVKIEGTNIAPVIVQPKKESVVRIGIPTETETKPVGDIFGVTQY